MTLIARYPTKKALKEATGQPLKYIETSIFGAEYTPNGEFVVCNRPHITGYKRHQEFFAVVTMQDGLINRVK